MKKSKIKKQLKTKSNIRSKNKTKKISKKKSNIRSKIKQKQCRRKKISIVMGEFKSGKLKMRNKKPVTNPKQAIAIALSVANRYC